MIAIRFHPPQSSFSPAWCTYRLADQIFLTDQPVSELEPFKIRQVLPEVLVDVAFTGDSADYHQLIYSGPGWIGMETRLIQCREGEGGYLLDISGIGQFIISTSGELINTLFIYPDATRQLIIEACLGPASILALALQGIWCLHAGAVTIGQQAVAFIGESGRGKSTLALHFNDQRYYNQQRINDDILPVRLTSSGVEALPHFPQLKLSAPEQPALLAGDHLPVAAVYVLTGGPQSSDQIDIQPMRLTAAVLALVRHSIATRLFNTVVLKKHLEFCNHAARVVPVRRLNYPHDYGQLPAVGERILSDLKAISAFHERLDKR